MSGGELQRVALTLCLGKPADVYLIDEPSAYLDSEQRLHAAKVIKRSVMALFIFKAHGSWSLMSCILHLYALQAYYASVVYCRFIYYMYVYCRFILHAKKTAFVVEHDFIMATYLADRVIVFEGQPSKDSMANRSALHHHCHLLSPLSSIVTTINCCSHHLSVDVHLVSITHFSCALVCCALIFVLIVQCL